MQLSISIEDTNQFLSLDISNDLTLKELKNLIQFEVDFTDFDVYFNGHLLSEDNKTLKELNFDDNEMILVKKQTEYSRQIQQRLQQSKIDESLEHALENTPEIFGSISMLYINLTLNGTPVKAFVDSGAQQTIISTKLAEECDLTSLIDKRFQGVAMGVGSSKIEGRIHSAMIKIESQFLPVSLTVLDTHVDFLLGLDMLRRYQGVIDLRSNVLRLADVETRFLGESEIPKNEFTQAADLAARQGSSGFGGNIFAPQSINAPPLQPQSTTSTTSTSANPFTSNLTPESTSTSTQPTNSTINTNTNTNTTNTPTFSEESINQLISLGVSRTEAINLLQQSGGNVEIAASLLFQ